MNPILKKILYFFAKRFIAGEELEDAIRETKKLNKQGITAIINFLGEHVKTEAEAEAALKINLEILEAIKKEGLLARISLKHSQLGLDIKYSTIYWIGNLAKILRTAETYGIPVEIDMEDYSYARQTLNFLAGRSLVSSVLPRQAIQAYLFRTADDLGLFKKHQISPRLCKGAYDEPETIAIKNQKKIREKYIQYADFLISRNMCPAFATQDLKIINYIRENYSEKKELFEFQFLFGMRKGLCRRLINEGYKIAYYLPFGKNWFSYGKRRWKFILSAIPRSFTPTL